MGDVNLLEIVRKLFNYALFTVNQTPITLASIFIFILLFIAFIFFANIFTRFISKRLLLRLHIDEGIRYNIERVIRYTVVIIGAIVALQFVGINLSSLAFIFGLLSVGIGFGLQNITSNFVSGLILLFERPIKVGDRVTVGDTEGDVIAINMRATTILSINNIAIIVPNSEFISSKVINWSYGDRKVRLNIEVGVSYTSDLDKVLRCIREVAAENGKVLEKPEPIVHLSSFGDSSWNMILRCWIADPKGHRHVTSDINCAMVRKFRENGVEIPYPQRDLHIRSSIPFPIEKTEVE